MQDINCRAGSLPPEGHPQADPGDPNGPRWRANPDHARALGDYLHRVEPGSDEEARRADLRAAMAMIKAPMSVGLVATPEDSFLLLDAVRCYQAGADVGAVFCAHASCERDLATIVDHSGAAPPGSHMWGLGKLLRHTHQTGRDGLPPDLVARLTELNESRKTLYHYGHSDSSRAIMRRTADLVGQRGETNVRENYRAVHGADGDNKAVWDFAMALALRQMALDALEAALLLRSWIGERHGGLAG